MITYLHIYTRQKNTNPLDSDFKLMYFNGIGRFCKCKSVKVTLNCFIRKKPSLD